MRRPKIWKVLKPALAQYYEETVKPHMSLRQLSNIRTRRSEEIQSYMDRLLVLESVGESKQWGSDSNIAD